MELSDADREWGSELEFLDDFGERPAARADDGEVCCRECGDPVGGGKSGLAGHVGAKHGFGLEEYQERNPMAPLEPPEHGPAVEVHWDDGREDPLNPSES